MDGGSKRVHLVWGGAGVAEGWRRGRCTHVLEWCWCGKRVEEVKVYTCPGMVSVAGEWREGSPGVVLLKSNGPGNGYLVITSHSILIFI